MWESRISSGNDRSVLIANSSAGLKHNKSTEKPAGLNCPDAFILDNEKAVVRYSGSLEVMLPPWVLGVKRAAAAAENSLARGQALLSAPETLSPWEIPVTTCRRL